MIEEGYGQAVELIKRCSCGDGFLASTTESSNYRRVWGRDGSIICLAALLTGENELLNTARQTLRTLAHYQGPHGEIPSNVNTETGRISYGGTAGRVDADLWFVIAAYELWRTTGDGGFLRELLPNLERVRFLLGCWEFNNRGLLYVPPTGDWADEYLHHGYVLYDQLLYLQAQCSLSAIHREVQNSTDCALLDKVSRLKQLIRTNYWIQGDAMSPEDVYHPVIYRKSRSSHQTQIGRYWLPFFSPHGYGYRFDAFANVLASLVGLSNQSQQDAVDQYIHEVSDKDCPLLPAFQPVITPKDGDWQDLQLTFSHSFKNRPNEFHNGGLWPLITGFYVADLARRGKRKHAESLLLALHQANKCEMQGQAWSFPEFLHGETHEPGGVRHLGWSAAAAIIGHHALLGAAPFHTFDD